MTISRNILIGLAGIACLLMLSLWYRGNIAGSQDINVYQGIAQKVSVERTQGGYLQSEYPPLPSALFFLLDNVPGFSFGDAWILFLLMIVTGTWLIAAAAGEKQAYLFPLSAAVTVFLLSQETVLARFDLLVGATLFIAWRAYVNRRDGTAAGFLLTAVALKIVPVLLLPFVIPDGFVRRWKKALIGSAVAVVVCTGIAFAVMGADGIRSNIESTLQYQGERDIQVETTWSGIRLLWDAMNGQKSTLGNNHMALHNESVGKWVQYLSETLLVCGTLGVGIWAWLKRKAKGQPAETWFLAGLCWILAVSPILSPQFIIWVLPLLVWFLLRRVTERVDGMTLLLLSLTAALGLLTQWIYPYRYGDLVDAQTLTAILTLNARNLTLFLLCGLLIREALTQGKVMKRT